MKVAKWVQVVTWIFAIMMGLGALLNWGDDLTGNWSALIAVSVLWIIGLVKKKPELIMSMYLVAVADELGSLIRGSEIASSLTVIVTGGLMIFVFLQWIKVYSWSFLMGSDSPNIEE